MTWQEDDHDWAGVRADSLPAGTRVRTFGGKEGVLRKTVDVTWGTTRMYIQPKGMARRWLHDDETVEVVGGR